LALVNATSEYCDHNGDQKDPSKQLRSIWFEGQANNLICGHSNLLSQCFKYFPHNSFTGRRSDRYCQGVSIFRKDIYEYNSFRMHNRRPTSFMSSTVSVQRPIYCEKFTRSYWTDQGKSLSCDGVSKTEAEKQFEKEEVREAEERIHHCLTKREFLFNRLLKKKKPLMFQ